MCLLGYAVDDAVVELLGMGPVLVVLPEASTSTVCLRWASAGQWMPRWQVAQNFPSTRLWLEEVKKLLF